MKKRILFLPYSHQLGSTYPLLDLAKHFRDKDEVIFAGEGKFMSQVESAGFKVIRLPEVPFGIYHEGATKGSMDFYTEDMVKNLVDAEIELYKKVKPDLVISQNRLTTRLSAEKAGIKHIAVVVSAVTRYRNIDLGKITGFSFSVLFKIPIIGQLFSDNANKIFELLSRSWLKPFNRIAKEYSVREYDNFFELFEGNLLTIIPESEKLFPLKSGYPTEQFFYTGPLLKHQYFDEPYWFNDVKERDGDFIYLSMGSTTKKIYPIALKKLIRIYGGSSKVNIVTNTSYLMDGEKQHMKAPKNVFITDIAPAEILFNLADLTICHGGNGTIYHSVIFGVPVFGITKRVEHEANMQQVKNQNIGDYMTIEDFVRTDDFLLRKKLDKMMHSKELHARTKDFSRVIQDEMVQIDNLIEKIREKI